MFVYIHSYSFNKYLLQTYTFEICIYMVRVFKVQAGFLIISHLASWKYEYAMIRFANVFFRRAPLKFNMNLCLKSVHLCSFAASVTNLSFCLNIQLTHGIWCLSFKTRTRGIFTSHSLDLKSAPWDHCRHDSYSRYLIILWQTTSTHQKGLRVQMLEPSCLGSNPGSAHFKSLTEDKLLNCSKLQLSH